MSAPNMIEPPSGRERRCAVVSVHDLSLISPSINARSERLIIRLSCDVAINGVLTVS